MSGRFVYKCYSCGYKNYGYRAVCLDCGDTLHKGYYINGSWIDSEAVI